MKIERLVAAFIDNMCVAFCCSPLFLLALNIRSVWATALQRILRNITLFVWPVEVVVLLLSSDDRRLTDKMFGTVVKRK